MSRTPLEAFPSGSEAAPNLSARFFNDPSMMASFEANCCSCCRRGQSTPNIPEVSIEGAPPPVPLEAGDTPLLNDDLKAQLKDAQSLTFTSAEDNTKNKEQPDYKLIQGEDGKLHLQKVGDGDPLEDGKLNIEVDTKNKALIEAIKQADQNLKEYVREMIALWMHHHPGNNNYPDWWKDVLASTPNLPPDTQPIPTERAPQPVVQQPEPRPQPQQPRTPTQVPGGGSGGGGSGGGGGFGGRGSGGGDGSGAGYEPGGRYRSGGEVTDTSSSGAKPSADQKTVLDNVRTVVEVAKEKGVDPTLAVAMMLVESGGDNRAVGDNGTSFGLFQLHDGGMLTSAGLTPQQAFDPRTNAEVSLGSLAEVVKRMGNTGEAAAASQRPADPAGYARKVNASMDEAAELIAQAEKTPPSDNAVASNDVREADGYAFPVANYNKDSVNLHWGSNHGGTDIFAERGTPVLAVRGGTVTSAGYSDIGGYNVSLKLDNGLVAYYAHLDQPPMVSRGQRVEVGQQIGVVGDTGNAKGTGPHLHFGMGTDIVNGSGPAGGTGANFDAVALLNNVLRRSATA